MVTDWLWRRRKRSWEGAQVLPWAAPRKAVPLTEEEETGC